MFAYWVRSRESKLCLPIGSVQENPNPQKGVEKVYYRGAAASITQTSKFSRPYLKNLKILQADPLNLFSLLELL